MEIQLITLASELGQALAKRQQCIAVAESCTGGLVTAALTEIAGCSVWFERGFITYSNAAKIDMLGVDPATLEQFGAVSSATALAMASGVLQHSTADYAIAITGIAGPGGGSASKPVGTVYIAWAQRDLPKQQCARHLFSGDRHSIRTQAATVALQFWVQQGLALR